MLEFQNTLMLSSVFPNNILIATV